MSGGGTTTTRTLVGTVVPTRTEKLTLLTRGTFPPARLFPESQSVAPWSGWRCHPFGLVALDLAAPVPAAEPGLVEPGLVEPGLADWTDPVAAPDRSGLADPLGVADPWSARAASAPG